jgi:hypothetical protein
VYFGLALAVEDGKAMQVSMTVDDPGAFAMPWSARSAWRRVEQSPMIEVACADNNAN